MLLCHVLIGKSVDSQFEFCYSTLFIQLHIMYFFMHFVSYYVKEIYIMPEDRRSNKRNFDGPCKVLYVWSKRILGSHERLLDLINDVYYYGGNETVLNGRHKKFEEDLKFLQT